MRAISARAVLVRLLAPLIAMAGLNEVATAENVPVPRVVIYPGDAISDAVLEDRDVKLSREPEKVWHLSRKQLVGMVAARTLLPGQAIPISATKASDIVRSGKLVTIVFAAGQMTITGRGLAMQSGRPGDTVSVQSQDSGTVLRGVIAPDGTIRLGD